MARYLVTGVAGFIASRVTEFLLADGHMVVGIDSLDNAYDIRMKHWRVDQIRDHPSFAFHKLDIRDRDSLRKLLLSTSDSTPFDAVINLAARAGVRQSVEDPWVYYETNVTGTLNLLESCQECGIDKFVLASSSGLYGKNNPMPYREDANTDRPFSPYAASKKAAETLCYSYHHLYDIDVTVLRYFTVYGPAGRPNMSIFRFVQWIHEGRPVLVYGDGKQSRDFTYVDDIARGTLAALRPLGYEVINLGSDTPIVLMDAIRLVEDLSGKRASIEYKPRHLADVLATWANIKKAEQLLGWRPMTTFDEGVRRAVNWYEENREWAKDVVT